MKKIVITIGRGWIARNLLHNDFFLILREKYQIIILTSADKDERFLTEFGHRNVQFVNLTERDHSSLDRIFFFFHKNLAYNKTVEQKNRYGIIGHARSKQPSYAGFLLKKIIFVPLSRLSFLRDFVRFLDNIFLQKAEVAEFVALLDREKPDVVISTNIAADSDAALLKAARRSKIKSIGIPKSWDNLEKNGFRVKADTFVVWSEFMAEEARIFQNYRQQDIRVIGIPQFDRYVKTERLLDRTKFCEVFGLDPARRIIFFGSEGNLVQSDSEITSIIYQHIENGEFAKPAQLLIRPHYGYKDDEQKFKHLFGKPHVAVDRFNNPSQNLRDKWDYSEEFSDRFTNCLYHSDMIISSYSTLSLDALAFDRPIINVAFDGREKVPFARSVARWGMDSYFQSVLDTGAVREVRSVPELRDAINAYLTDPILQKKERELLRQRFCFKIDGQSGKRFVAVVDEVIDGKKYKKI